MSSIHQDLAQVRKPRVHVTYDVETEGAAIKKAPQELSVGLLVTPYMGEPVYSNTLSMAEFMKTGFDLDVPYGWYSLRLRGFRYGRFAFGGTFHRISIDPIPIIRPSSGDK